MPDRVFKTAVSRWTSLRPAAASAAAAPSGDEPFRPEESDGSQLASRARRLRSVEGTKVTLDRSLAGRVRGSEVRLEQSAAAVALAKDLHLRQSASVVSIGGKLAVEQSAGQWLVGGLVQAKQVFAVAVIAAKVEGQVRCLFDAKGAFAFGAGVALMTGLLRLITGRK